MKDYTNSQMTALIDEQIHHARNREILKLRLMDGLTYEKIAEKVNMSVQQVKSIVYKSQEKLLKYL